VQDFRLDRQGVEHPFTRFSDALLMFLLKARRAERFRDNIRVELGAKPDKPPSTRRRQTLVPQLLATRRVSLVVTVRTGETAPDAIVGSRRTP
jgi:hypothetical protein